MVLGPTSSNTGQSNSSVSRRPAVMLALGLITGAGATASSANAQPASSENAQTSNGKRRRPSIAAHAEGQLVFLATELQITAAQMALWQNIVNVVRQNAAERDSEQHQLAQSTDAISRLQARYYLISARAASFARFIGAFQPLYDSMSNEQRTAADSIFAP